MEKFSVEQCGIEKEVYYVQKTTMLFGQKRQQNGSYFLKKECNISILGCKHKIYAHGTKYFILQQIYAALKYK